MSRRQDYYEQPTCPPPWLWLITGILIGFFLALLLYLDRLLPNQKTEDRTQKTEYTAPPVQKTEDKGQKIETSAPRFEFYDILPMKKTENSGQRTEESIPPSAANPPLPSEMPPGNFMLQIAAFQNIREAEELKARLALLGIQAFVQQANLNGSAWYRVRVGPFTDAAQANQIQEILLQNGYQAIVAKF